MPEPKEWTPRNRPARGHLRFDRRFPALGVPRLQRSSGTSDPEEFKKRNGYLTTLAGLGCAEELQAFASGEVTISDIGQAIAKFNVRGFLADFRAQRQSASVPGAQAGDVSKPVMPVPVEVTPQAVQATPEPPDSPPDELSRPLWRTSIEKLIPLMDDIEQVSRRRYLTTMRSLRLKMHLFSLSESALSAMLELNLTEDQREAIEFARSRGLTMRRLLHALDPKQREPLTSLRNDGIRLGEKALERLRGVAEEAWHVLAAGSDWIPDLDTVDHIASLDEQDRDKLRISASVLGPDAVFHDLARLSSGDWKRFAKHWGGSAADWNHTRRCLSAVLTALLGTPRATFRQTVIDRMLLLKEHERMPDITPDIFLRIVAKLPPEAKRFPLVLVLTGARMSEYGRMVRADLKPHTFRVQINGTKTDGSVGEVQIDPDLWHYIDAGVPAPHGARWMRRVWREACAAIGVRGITLHDLRHCHGQWALDGGAQEQSVQTTLRHTTAAMTRRYVRTQQRGDVATALATQLSDAVEG